MFYVTKQYGHELGLSACFRQWKAKSHCRFLHGYPLSFKFVFGCEDNDLLEDWVIDFGGLKEVKLWLCNTFDHKLLIAEDDPQRERLEALRDVAPGNKGRGRSSHDSLADPIILPRVGCEGFALFVFEYVDRWLELGGHKPRVFLASTEVREHAGNSAIYQPWTMK